MPDNPLAQPEDLHRCIRCGLCLNACPTFRVLGEEMDSPRGRIYQIAQADAGRLPLDPTLVLHLDRCLDCRACVTACPSGVPYGDIIEQARGEIRARHPAGFIERYLLQSLIPSPKKLRRAASLIRFYQRSGLQRAARASGLLRRLGLADTERYCPPLDAPAFTALGDTFPADSIYPAPRARVIFLPGCAQNALLPELNCATVRVLCRQGCEVTVAGGVGCCGALHVHAGMRDFARQLAAANCAHLESLLAATGATAILTNAAGCGATLKDYPSLFDHDPAGQARATAVAARIQDVTEFLGVLGLRHDLLGPVPAKATYQDPCHLAHAQKIRRAPRALMAQIPELTLVEMQRPDQCCGGAGIYNLKQPEIAAALLKDRVDAVLATGAQLLITANPGCMLQLRSAAPQVLHVVELLDAAHRALA